MAADRPLPQNLDAERAVLGAVLIDESVIPSARQILNADDFLLPENRRVFAAMLGMADAKQAIDLLTVNEELQRQGILEAAGGTAYLAGLMDGVPRLTHIEHYARIVREKAALRNLIHATDAIQQEAFRAEATADTVLDCAKASIAGIAPLHRLETRRIQLVSASDFLARRSEDDVPWIVNGLLPARSQTIWQGRPKVGKSHSLLQLAFDAACGLPVFGHFAVTRSIRTAYVELEEPEAITKDRFAKMLRAHKDIGPDASNLLFLSRCDLQRLRVLPKELAGVLLKDFASALRDKGVELVVLIAVRRLVYGNLKDTEVAERLNDALDVVAQETGAALGLGHHSRKEEAETLEAQGIGSTFVSARADATFDMARKGNARKVGVEARYATENLFFLQKESVGDGELIRWCEAPPDPKNAKREAVINLTNAGKSTRQAAKEAGVSAATVSRWVREAAEGE
jgi:DnaB helicase-like protein/AAA domain-containing protein